MHIPFLSCVIATLSCATSIRAQYYPLTGVQTGKTQSGSRPARQNILDLQKDSAQLYYLSPGCIFGQTAKSFSALYTSRPWLVCKPQVKMTPHHGSKLQVCYRSKPYMFCSDYSGIHGRPYIAWNNVQNTPGAPRVGYCTHSKLYFLPPLIAHCSLVSFHKFSACYSFLVLISYII